MKRTRRRKAITGRKRVAEGRTSELVAPVAPAVRSDDHHQRLLLDIANVLATNLQPERLFTAIAQIVRTFIGVDRASLALYEPERDEFEIVALALQEETKLGKGGTIPHSGSRVGKVFDSGRPYLSTIKDSSTFYEDIPLIEEGMHTGLVVPMRVNGNMIGTFNVNSRKEDAFNDLDVTLLTSIADQIAIAVANSRLYQNARRRAERLKQENAHLQDLVQGAETAAKLLLHCPSIRPVIERLIAIAQSDSTVLISGETGSGKGVMARALHAWSGRRYQPFLSCDCASLPEGIGTDFFGLENLKHRARDTRGRPNRAEGATLLLDEVSEIPRQTQARLLSVIQDHAIRSAGSSDPVKVDFRVIATTNRDLAAESAAGRFREDLYYRLSVMKVTVSPLRERRLDIVPLAEHFLAAYAHATEKAVRRLSPQTVNLLQKYSWPGNVRELDHVIEGAVLLHTRGDTLEIDPDMLDESQTTTESPGDGPLVPLAEYEAEYIRRVLQATNGRIAGPRGAAKILRINPSTLRSRMHKLGIAFKHREIQGDNSV